MYDLYDKYREELFNKIPSDKDLFDAYLDLAHERLDGKLSKERIEKLDSIGFPWKYYEGYAQGRFDEVKLNYGFLEVVPADAKYLKWVMARREGKLSEVIIKQLDAIGTDWEYYEGYADGAIAFKLELALKDSSYFRV